MQTAFAVDWIRATSKYHSIKTLIDKFSYGFAFEDWTTVKPLNGYEAGLKHPFGQTIFWSSSRHDMGVNIMFTGRTLSELVKRTVNPLNIVSWLSNEEFAFTRLDLAIDVFEVEIDIPALAECEHTGSVNNDPVLVTKGRKARGGATLYLGGRQSAKFLRIYDKAKERKLFDTNWTRIELELKGKTATKIAHKMEKMSYEEIAKMTQGMMRGMYDPDNETYRQALDAEPIKVGSTKNESHNTYDWLMSSVAKTMARTMLELPHMDVWQTFKAEVDKHIRELAAKAITMDQ